VADAPGIPGNILRPHAHGQLGINALNGTRHDEAVDHFVAAVNGGACWFKLALQSQYKDFVVVRRCNVTVHV
jgi:hypothetical protein